MEEIEVKFLNIDVKALEKKLVSVGAKKVSDEMFEEWLFSKPEWDAISGRVRVRKQDKKVFIAYKETHQATSKGNLEIEFSVSDLEAALSFINKMGLKNPRHQQKRRIHYELKDAVVDIDFWPRLPPLVEIEGPNFKLVTDVAKKLGFNLKDRCDLDTFQIYKQIYGIDITDIKELVF